ncbi:MAG: energy-coupling factor transporter transmembrane protein EcfT [Candidatus Marinimicrobia bacterium]|nr:energy-coupling factor transporter transmembrane protein EcfT [Candidatus Neomarinimicrobiota bacterium]
MIFLAMKGSWIATLSAVFIILILLLFENSGFKRFWKVAKYSLILIPLTFIFHFVSLSGIFRVTEEIFIADNVQKAAFFMSRVGVLVSAGAYFAMTVEPSNLAESLRETAAPLGKLGLPIDRIMLLFLLTFSFIPIISQQATRIREAQIARGLSMGKGIVNRIGKALPLMIPLIVLSISRAEQLSLVLESRGYNSPIKRTSLKKFRFSSLDYTMAIAVITITAFID